MLYAEFNAKKITVMLGIVGALALVIWGTILLSERFLGNFSLAVVQLRLKNIAYSWWYRLEFNAQFPPETPGGRQSLLATVGLSPPVSAPISAAATAPAAAAQAIPVLLYHGIVDPPSEPSDISFANFKQQLFALKAAGWQTVGIYDFVDAMQGKKKLPAKSFLLTFDDGRVDSYYPAEPILEALGYRAVMYVIAGHSFASENTDLGHYYLSLGELRQLLVSGRWDLQAHSDIGHAYYSVDSAGTLGSFYGNLLWLPVQEETESTEYYRGRIIDDFTKYFRRLAALPLYSPGRLETPEEYQARVTTDLLSSKQELETYMGVNVESFAYPYSDFAQTAATNYPAAKKILVEEVDKIYPVSFYQWYPGGSFSSNYLGVDGQFLKRIEPAQNWSGADLLRILDASQPKSLPYVMRDPAAEGWDGAWGDTTPQGGSFLLAAASSTKGASALLDGSRLWNNYNYQATVDWENPTEVISLFGRYFSTPQNSSYVSCTVGAGVIKLDQRVDGVVMPLTRAKAPAIQPEKNSTVGMILSGNYAECTWNGAVMLSGHIDPRLTMGGIGMEVWDSTGAGRARTLVKWVGVSKT